MAAFETQKIYILGLRRDKGAAVRQNSIPQRRTVTSRSGKVCPIAGRYAWLTGADAFPSGATYDLRDTFVDLSRLKSRPKQVKLTDMPITGIHHFNIRVDAAELDELERFYCEAIGLTAGPRPPFRSGGTWLYAGENPLVHLTEMHSGEVVAPGSPQTLPEVAERRNAMDHIALAATDLESAVQRLKANRVPFTLTKVPAVGEIQIFCRDPSGNGIELIFALHKAITE
jgi:catechol 2,3-dioxygenase-like lactoylglutathione lyase family enzyme